MGLGLSTVLQSMVWVAIGQVCVSTMQCHKGKGTSCRDLLASKVSMVDGIKDVSERIQFGSLILKNSTYVVQEIWRKVYSGLQCPRQHRRRPRPKSSIVHVHSLASLGMSIEVARAVEVWTFVWLLTAKFQHPENHESVVWQGHLLPWQWRPFWYSHMEHVPHTTRHTGPLVWRLGQS